MAQAREHVKPDTLTDVETGIVVVVGVVAAIFDHFWRLIDVLLVVVAATWFLYMCTGLANSMVAAYVESGWRGAVDAIDDRKMVEGVGRGVALFAAVILLGFGEIVQKELWGAYMPAVVPVLGMAFGFFAFKISGHITGLWMELGKAVEHTMSSIVAHNRRKTDKEDEGDGT